MDLVMRQSFFTVRIIWFVLITWFFTFINSRLILILINIYQNVHKIPIWIQSADNLYIMETNCNNKWVKF